MIRHVPVFIGIPTAQNNVQGILREICLFIPQSGRRYHYPYVLMIRKRDKPVFILDVQVPVRYLFFHITSMQKDNRARYQKFEQFVRITGHYNTGRLLIKLLPI